MEAACSIETLTPIDQAHGVTLQKAITLALNTHSKPRDYMEVTSQLQTPIALTEGKILRIPFGQEARWG
jgi:hypothetical protein